MPPEKFEAWHDSHRENPPVDVGADFAATPCCVGLDHPVGCPICAWQSVLLKQSGSAPGAASCEGCREEFLPFVWHCAHAEALPGSVVECFHVEVAPLQGFGACGAFTL